MPYVTVKKITSLLCFSPLLWAGIYSSAYGQEQGQELEQKQLQENSATSGLHGFMTVMPGYAPDFEGSSDYKVVPYASVRLDFDGYYLQTEGAGAVINLLPSGNFKIGPAFNYRMPRNDKVKDLRIKNMMKIKGAFEAGGFIAYDFNGVFKDWDNLEVRAKFLMDTGDVYDGKVLELSASYRMPLNRKVFLGLSIGANFTDENYRKTYFGVSAMDAARSGLKEFSVETDFRIKDVNIAFISNYSLTDNWGIFTVLSYTRLVGDIKNSPILKEVGSANQYFGALGLSYRF